MRELPILFSATMVRAILEGRKTVTRRAVKPLKGGFVCVGAKAAGDACSRPDYFAVHASPDHPQKQGNRWVVARPGDRLYVRETWGLFDPFPTLDTAEESMEVVYKASHHGREPARWRPSIHMPKEYARIWLEVTAVRVERLRDITAEQAIAEGMQSNLHEHDAIESLRNDFAQLWNGLAKAGSRWDDNPWVWVVEFKRLENVHG